MTDDFALPAYGRGLAVQVPVDLPADIARVLDAWARSQVNVPDREAAILFALRDWLTGLGMLPAGSDAHEGLH